MIPIRIPHGTVFYAQHPRVVWKPFQKMKRMAPYMWRTERVKLSANAVTMTVT